MQTAQLMTTPTATPTANPRSRAAAQMLSRSLVEAANFASSAPPWWSMSATAWSSRGTTSSPRPVLTSARFNMAGA